MSEKVDLNPKIAQLTKVYLKRSRQDFSELVNEALKFYIINQLNSKDVQKLLQQKDTDTFDVDELFKNMRPWME